MPTQTEFPTFLQIESMHVVGCISFYPISSNYWNYRYFRKPSNRHRSEISFSVKALEIEIKSNLSTALHWALSSIKL